MTAAVLRDIDPFEWLPPHMRPAAARHGFGLAKATRALHCLGYLWYTDGHAAIYSSIPATGQRPAESDRLAGMICLYERVDTIPVVLDGHVRVGCAIISAAYHGMVTELHPCARWEAGGGLDPVVAWVGCRPVAVVMPMDPREDDG